MEKTEKLWTMLIHLGTNMWREIGNTRGVENGVDHDYNNAGSADLRFDEAVWNEQIKALRENGCNCIMLDVGDGYRYESHPEIAVNGAWTREKLEAELNKLHELGFEVIPKLNFSSTHDAWLKQYSQMLSTEEYYRVCKDLIDEVCDIFKPRYFHLGMDEEGFDCQRDYDFVVIRQGDLWWHDLYYLVNCVEQHGARAMMWSDYARHKPEEFIEKCPKSVVQCPWYYFDQFTDFHDGDFGNAEAYRCRVAVYKLLADAGYDIFACGSSIYYPESLVPQVEYCEKELPADRLLGYMQTVWYFMIPESIERQRAGMTALKHAREAAENAQ